MTADPEQAKTDKDPIRYPVAVFFIVFNAFCDRFAFYGIRAILVLYITNALSRTDDEATLYYHIFLLLCCLFPLGGAILADSAFGKIRTIFLFTAIYFVGNGLVAAAAVPPLQLPQFGLTIAGLFLVSIGTGCVRPCVVALGGDQFKLPEQEKQLTEYFSVFYFAISVGSLAAYFLTPVLGKDVMCFGGQCYSLAFSVTTGAMMVAFVAFIIGKSVYKTTPTDKNIIVEVLKCMVHAARMKFKKGKSSTESHWLDHAVSTGKFERPFVQDIKALGKLLVLYLPLPMFWALLEQQGSRWTLQASRMDGRVFGYTVKPDHMQLINPLLILPLIPIFEKIVYPLLRKCGLLKTPLHKLGFAMILACASFLVAGLIELQLESEAVGMNSNSSGAALNFQSQQAHDLNLTFFTRDTNLSTHNVNYNYSLIEEVGVETTTLFDTSEETETETYFMGNETIRGLMTVQNPSSKVTSVHMLWLLPQFIIITVAEVMFAVPGMEFSYSQAPESMKSVMQAIWLVTIACGNFIVTVIAKAKIVSLQSSEFFLFAALMILATLLFMFLSRGFKGKKMTGQGSVKPFREMSALSLSHTNPSIKSRRSMKEASPQETTETTVT